MSAVRVGLIGPGRVGGALVAALPEGYRLAGVAGRSRAGAEAVAARAAGAWAGAPSEVAAAADVVLLCVPDDALAGVVRELARDDAVVAGSRWVHVAGGHGLAPLRPVRLAGARVAACHPAQTFPDAERGAAALPGAAWAVTAEAGDVAWAEALVVDLGGRPHRVADEARVAYHAALAVGSNATAAVVALARDLLLGAGVEDPEAFLAPLATASAEGAAGRGAAALTGPVRRGDAGTVAAHLAELEVVLPEAAEAYRCLARLALSYARRAGLDPAAAASVAEALEGR